jgi:hypothetical protein
MADDKNNTGSPGRDRINGNEGQQVRCLAKDSRVSAGQLHVVMKAAGPAITVRDLVKR